MLNSDADRVDCSICFDAMTASNSSCLDPCGHRFHDKCINVSLFSQTQLCSRDFPDLGMVGSFSRCWLHLPDMSKLHRQYRGVS